MRLSVPLTLRKYTFLKGNYVFDLRDVFQERIPGVQRDLPAIVEKAANFMYFHEGQHT